jgi:hypothetical protein
MWVEIIILGVMNDIDPIIASDFIIINVIIIIKNIFTRVLINKVIIIIILIIWRRSG